MALDNTENIARYRGANLVDRDGDKIGKIDEIYLDDRTGEPEWVLVNTGMFGTRSTFVPLRDASQSGEDLSVPYDKAKVKDAPNMDADGHLSEDEERQLYEYYEMDYGTDDDQSSYDQRDMDRTDYDTTGTAGVAGVGADYDTTTTTGTTTTGTSDYDTTRDRDRDYATTGTSGTVAEDTSGPETDDAMTLSQERLNVGTTQRESGRARLRKYLTTDTATETVPTSREEVRVEREPITEANRGAAMSGADLSEEEVEVTLREEVPVVEKEVVPTERIRLEKDTVSDQQTVSEDVRREEVDVDEGRTGTPGTPRPATNDPADTRDADRY